MKIRELKDHPEILQTFDYYNDYKDTRRWAEYSYPEIIPALDKGNEEFWKNKFNKSKENK